MSAREKQNYEENTENKPREQVFTDMERHRMHACLPSLPDCLAHICIRVERRRAEEHSRRTLWSLSLCLFDAPCGNKPADLGMRRQCWMLSGWMCVCVGGCWLVCMCDHDEYHGGDCTNLSRPWLQSKWAHKHTPPWVALFCYSQVHSSRRECKPNHPPLPHSFFGIIKHHGESDNHDCQTTDLYPTPSLRASLRKCHFTFPSGSTLEAVHRRNLWILTQRVCWQHSLPTSRRLPLFLTPLSPLALTSSPFLLGLLHSPPPISHPFPPLTSFSSLLFPACQADFRLVASGLTYCRTIETVITTVSE